MFAFLAEQAEQAEEAAEHVPLLVKAVNQYFGPYVYQL